MRKCGITIPGQVATQWPTCLAHSTRDWKPLQNWRRFPTYLSEGMLCENVVGLPDYRMDYDHYRGDRSAFHFPYLLNRV